MDRQLSSRSLIYALNGSHTYLGTITSASVGVSAGNEFSIPAGSLLLVQATGGVYIKPGVSTDTVSAGDGLYLLQDEKWYVCLTSSQTHLHVAGAAGGAALKVWRLS